MKHINEYLLGKKNKVAKSINEEFPEGYCFVVGFHDAWTDLCNELKDEFLILDNTGGNPQGFILSRYAAAEWIEKENIIIYEIPEDYKSFDDFVDSYIEGEINVEDDLKEIKTLEDLGI